MMMRYALLMAAAAAAVWGAIDLGESNASRVLVDAGQGIPSANLSLLVLGTIAMLIALSLCRFVIFGLPSMMGGWYRGSKSWLFAAGAAGVLYGVLSLM